MKDFTRDHAEGAAGLTACSVRRKCSVTKGVASDPIMRVWLSLLQPDIDRGGWSDWEEFREVTLDVWSIGGQRTVALESKASCPTFYRSWLSKRHERLTVLLLPCDVYLGDGTYNWQGVQYWTLKVGASSEAALARLTVLAKLGLSD